VTTDRVRRITKEQFIDLHALGMSVYGSAYEYGYSKSHDGYILSWLNGTRPQPRRSDALFREWPKRKYLYCLVDTE